MGSVMEFVLDHVPHMIIQKDEDGNLIYSNSLWREFTGHTDYSSPWSHFIHTEDSANWSRWGNVDGPFFTECRIKRHNDGNYVWHKIRSYFVGGPNQGLHIRIATDIHNEKIVATELDESRAREDVYRQLLSNSCDPIVTFDARSGMVVNVNRAAEREFQYPSIELVGRSFNVLVPRSYTDEGPAGRLAACMRSGMRGNLLTVGGSEPIHVVRRDGERVPVTLSLVDFVIESQQLYVATLSIATRALNQQEELRSSKDSFLRTMSHELRTPLFGILGTLSTILDDSASMSNSPSTEENLNIISTEHPSLQSSPFAPATILSELGLRGSGPLSTSQVSSEYDLRASNKSITARPSKNDAELRQMEACTRSLLSVVNNMIAYYKIEIGITPLEMPVQFRTLLQEVCGYYESCVSEGVIFTYEVSDTVPLTVISDATLLRHALANLVSNALRFTPKGAVAVVVDVVEPAPSPDQVLLWISVADTGIGIAPEFFSQVFQPFTQMDSSNSRKYGGAGLGLAVCKRVVDLLGGAISFNSGIGLGTVFEISLPVSLQSQGNPEPDLPPQQTIPEERSLANYLYESDPLTLRPSSPFSPRLPISSALLVSPSSSFCSSTSSSFYNPTPSSSFYNPSPSSSFYDSPSSSFYSISTSTISDPTPITVAYQQQHSEPPSPEINRQESTENDRRSFSRNNNNSKFHSALSTIMENEADLELAEKTEGISQLSLENRTNIPTPDPNNPLEDYAAPRLPDPPTTRKSPASAPASPRIQAIPNYSPVPSTSRFLRRPSFPFVLDDPSVSLMMHVSSPALSSPSSVSVANSPISSPRSNVQSPVSPPVSSPLVFPLHMRVLVVDDNLVNQNVLKKMLRHMECIVSTAQHGKEALEVLFDNASSKYVGYGNFDLILMDCQMPVMDGFQTTKNIRDWEIENASNKRKMRIISLSASGSSETEKECYESGSDGFISKPVTLQSLCRVLADRTSVLAPPT